MRFLGASAVLIFACAPGDATQDAGPDVTVDVASDAIGASDAGALVNGTCGAPSGDSFIAAPSANLCTSGVASAVGGAGPWTWTCAGENGGTIASCSARALPSAVATAGYATHTFASTFDSTTVDTKNTKASGFDWYVWNLYGQADASKIKLEGDGSVTLEGDTTGPNGEIVTGARGAGSFVGTAFGGGGYFEATLKFDPAAVVDAGFTGWPSWWSIPMEHVFSTANTWWDADAGTNYNNDVEADYFEYDIQGSPPNRYGGTLHDWYGVYTKTCAPSSYCDWRIPYSTLLRTTPANTDFTQYHSAGFLWVPATQSTPGTATFFFDRVALGPTTSWAKWVDQPIPTGVAPASPQPPWAFGAMDQEHYLLILGTGVNEPMTIQRVDVWQASAQNNMHS